MSRKCSRMRLLKMCFLHSLASGHKLSHLLFWEKNPPFAVLVGWDFCPQRIVSETSKCSKRQSHNAFYPQHLFPRLEQSESQKSRRMGFLRLSCFHGTKGKSSDGSGEILYSPLFTLLSSAPSLPTYAFNCHITQVINTVKASFTSPNVLVYVSWKLGLISI